MLCVFLPSLTHLLSFAVTSSLSSITDSNGLTDTAVVVITVNPDTPGEPPVAQDDAATTVQGTPASGNLLDNDASPSGLALTVNTTPITQPSSGTVTINADGTWEWVATDAGFVGQDSFVYEIEDSDGKVVSFSFFGSLLSPLR